MENKYKLFPFNQTLKEVLKFSRKLTKDFPMEEVKDTFRNELIVPILHTSMDFGDLKDYVIEMTSPFFPLTYRYRWQRYEHRLGIMPLGGGGGEKN
jgi:hypothetical protein